MPDWLLRRWLTGACQYLDHEQQRQCRPCGDDPGAHSGLRGADVGGDGGDDTRGERDPGDWPDLTAAASVVDHRHGGDDEHAVDAERQGVGDLGAFAVVQRDVDHVRIGRPCRDRGDGGG
jgi:hypothetical protein